MKRRTFTMAVGSLTAAAALAPSLASAAPQLKGASNLPAEHPGAVRSTQMWNDVRRETNGLVDVKSFNNSVLGGDPYMMAQLRSGAIDFYLAPGGTLGAMIDVANSRTSAMPTTRRATRGARSTDRSAPTSAKRRWRRTSCSSRRCGKAGCGRSRPTAR